MCGGGVLIPWCVGVCWEAGVGGGLGVLEEGGGLLLPPPLLLPLQPGPPVLARCLLGGTFPTNLTSSPHPPTPHPTQVISTSGDTHLGGEDFDQRVMEYFIKLIKRKYKKDISGDARALQKLRREAERAKRALSSQHQVSSGGGGGGKGGRLGGGGL